MTFQHRAFRDFPGLDSNIQLSDEEVEESASEAEVDVVVEVLLEAPDRAPLPDDLRVPPEASSSALPVWALPLDPSISPATAP